MSPEQDSRSSGRPGSRDSACSAAALSPVYSSPRQEEEVLDFSTKRPASPPALNLTKSAATESSSNGPLDLSVGSRKRSPSPQDSLPRKSLRPAPLMSPWSSPVVASHFPYFAAAAVAASSLSSKNEAPPEIWNGKMKVPDKSFGGSSPGDATKALEKMSELSKLSGEEFRPGSGKHSAWQSHWLNKGADQAKDVLKCVWCKQSFPSLAAMTTHMKEAKHCGVNLSSAMIPPAPPIPQPLPVTPPAPPPPSSKSSSSSSDLNLLIKETMPLPRKLVRGQDVWLGKGAEQTRQILKCMWCGQSFRSLAEMTSHMQQTQHYTNIISQEQIISWKSAEEGKSCINNNSSSSVGSASAGSGASTGAASSHVSAVLTCKVCDQAFSSLKELSNHMVKNSHYKEHIMRSITESGSRRRQTKEKRKKSLPVRKLLELERAQNELKNGESMALLGKHVRDEHSAGRITCEKCKEKIDMAVFVDHIRICVGGDSRNLLKNALLSSSMLPETHIAQSIGSGRKKEESSSTKEINPEGKGSSPSVLNAIEKLIEKSFDSRSRHGPGGFVGPGTPGQAPVGSSILKRLGIDESVDYTKPLIDAQTMNLLRNYHRHDNHGFIRRERSGSESSSISEKGRADSLTPERKYEPCHSATPRATPESRVPTPPSSEENIKEEDIKKEPPEQTDEQFNSSHKRVEIKEEPECRNDDEEERSSPGEEPLPKAMTEEASGRSPEEEDDEERRSPRTATSPSASPRPGLVLRSPSVDQSSPCRNSSSPASSERSTTPRSTSDKKSSGSLGALSSMFDNLPGGSGVNASGEQTPGGRGTSHPLAALQKLCDKTESQPRPASSAATMQSSGSPAPPPASPGSILAFSWACNDAVMTADSIMKCAFCDTPFISKGAYRHHLSKIHFVKDGVIPEPVVTKAQPSSPAPTSSKQPPANPPPAPTQSPPQPPSLEESPHSKFLKYTELAKQLSSKYV